MGCGAKNSSSGEIDGGSVIEGARYVACCLAYLLDRWGPYRSTYLRISDVYTRLSERGKGRRYVTLWVVCTHTHTCAEPTVVGVLPDNYSVIVTALIQQQYLQPMIPPKRFDIIPADSGMLRRSKCVQIFL